jgi:hypothetical protein
MGQFLKISNVKKQEDFIPRHTDNFDEVGDEESQASDKFY